MSHDVEGTGQHFIIFQIMYFLVNHFHKLLDILLKSFNLYRCIGHMM